MQINIRYPSLEAECQILLKTTGIETPRRPEVLNAKELIEAQKLVRQLPVGDSVVQSILDIVRSARPSEQSLPELKRANSLGVQVPVQARHDASNTCQSFD